MMNRLKRVHLLQSVYIRFKSGEEGMVGLARLRALVQHPSLVSIDDRDRMAMQAVLVSRSWGMDANRNFQVFGLQHGDENQVRAVLRDVETMTVGDHGAKGLCSGRSKKQGEEAIKLSASVITQVFIDQLTADWGFVDVDTRLVQPDDPALNFLLKFDGVPIVSILLDGFSGRMSVDGVWGDELFNRPEQLQKLIQDTIEARLEELTATYNKL